MHHISARGYFRCCETVCTRTDLRQKRLDTPFLVIRKASLVKYGILTCLHLKVGYTCSAGIGCSKATAKLAGELHKPAQQTTILPE